MQVQPKNNQSFSRKSGKGGKREGAGRPKGVPNKLNSDIKGMILSALNSAGGEKYLLAQSSANPVAFMSLIGKVLPTTLAGDPNAPLFPSRIEIKLVGPK